MATTEPSPPPPAEPHPQPAPPHAKPKPWKRIIFVVVLLIVIIASIPLILNALDTVSTDDAYVNGHVTFVAPRVPGQVSRVLVDDNNRVHKGDLLVQLDPEPYQVAVNIAQAAVDAAQTAVVVAQSQARSTEGQARSLRYGLQRSIEDVDNQIALLHSKIATLDSQKATLADAQANYDRAVPLVQTGAVSKEDFDTRTAALMVAKAQVQEALQGVYQVRVALGLPPKPESGDDLGQTPDNLDQTFSTVKVAQYALMQTAAQLGVYDSFNLSPKEMLANFYKRDPSGDIDKIYAKLVLDAPAVKQAQAKLEQSQADLDNAKLNLSYCNVFSEIDGIVTRRDVNPGNNVIAGQSLMAVRSVTVPDIWIDANFKETQLSYLRIGQPVDLDVDMYGSHQHFKGVISGFEEGTGSTLALLPAENATGNFVKVVQRLPVRIDLVDYDPDKLPLFIGLSVEPTIHLSQAPSGPNAGKFLQPYMQGLQP